MWSQRLSHLGLHFEQAPSPKIFAKKFERVDLPRTNRPCRRIATTAVMGWFSVSRSGQSCFGHDHKYGCDARMSAPSLK